LEGSIWRVDRASAELKENGVVARTAPVYSSENKPVATAAPSRKSVMITLSKRHKRSQSLASRRAGLTLVEMIVVLAIIAVVAVLIVPNVIGRPDQARVTVARTDLKTIATALRVYRLDNGDYPTTAQGLQALVEKPTSPPEPVSWATGGYLPELPADPWGKAYVYRSPGRTGTYDLISYGKDGREGGEDLDADLTDKTR
jgi:general secretion pathway protein G